VSVIVTVWLRKYNLAHARYAYNVNVVARQKNYKRNLKLLSKAVNLMHLHVFFATLYKKMDSAEICFDLFVVQIPNFILHIFAYFMG